MSRCLLFIIYCSLFMNVSTYADDVEMHFDLDPIGQEADGGLVLRLPGTLNGRRMTYMLDTGASANVISPDYAASLGLRPLVDSVTVEGVGSTIGQMVIADSIELGNLILRQVPFCVVDVSTGRPEYDRYLRHLRAILGRPLLEELGKTTIDFEHHQLTAPRKPKKKQKRTRRSNLAVVDNVLLLTVNDSLRLIPDFGATHSTLQKSDITFSSQGETTEGGGSLSFQGETLHADTVHYAGVGGVVTVVEYTLHDFPIRIDKKNFHLPSITVSSSASYESRLGMDFFTRQRRVVFDLRRWRLTVK